MTFSLLDNTERVGKNVRVMSFAGVSAHQSACVQRVTREKSDCGWRETAVHPKTLAFRGMLHKIFEVFSKTDMSENY